MRYCIKPEKPVTRYLSALPSDEPLIQKRFANPDYDLDLKVPPERWKDALAVDDPRTLEAQALWNEAFQMGRKNAIEECGSRGCMWCNSSRRSK